MEKGDLPVCAICDIKYNFISLPYDGSMDLSLYLKQEINKEICDICNAGNYVFLQMSYGQIIVSDNYCNYCLSKKEIRIVLSFK